MIYEAEGEELSHYTNENGFKDILRSGKLLGFTYDINSKLDKSKGKYYEVCMVRSDMSPRTKAGRISLSDNIGGIRLLLNRDAIINLRGVRKEKPINELYVLSKGKMEEIMAQMRRGSDVSMIDIDDGNNEFMYDVERYLDKYGINYEEKKVGRKTYAFTDDRPPFIFNGNGRKFGEQIFELQVQHYIYNDKKKNREGESRFIVGKDTGIPVSSKYMKIRMEPGVKLDTETSRLIDEYKRKDPGLFEQSKFNY